MNFCPHCGYNLTPDRPVEIDGWKLDGVFVFYRGEKIKATEAQAMVAYSIARGRGAIVRTETILARACLSESSPQSVSVLMWKLRQACKAHGAILPVKGSQGRYSGGGYRWLTGQH